MIFNIKPFPLALNDKAIERAKKSGNSVTQEKILMRMDMCERAGIAEATFNFYNQGLYLPTKPKMQAITDYLDMPVMFASKSKKYFVLPSKMWNDGSK